MKGMSLLNEVDYEITNVYRTENYIVCQTVHVCYGDNGNILISDDIFRRRTPERDAKFEEIVSAMPPCCVVMRSIAILPLTSLFTISASTQTHFLGLQFAFIASATSAAFSVVGHFTRTIE